MLRGAFYCLIFLFIKMFSQNLIILFTATCIMKYNGYWQ
jgi:hypothetical protein